MSETKALDGLVNEKNWHDGIGGALIFAATVLGDGWLDQAADELAILKEKESDNRKGWDDCYEVNTHLRAELDDMKRCYDRDANCECDQGVPTIIKLRAELELIYSAIGTTSPTETLAHIAKLQTELDGARKVIDAAAHELGIPIPGYIQPVANAAYMLWAWLKAHPE